MLSLRTAVVILLGLAAQRAWGQTLPPQPEVGTAIEEPCEIAGLLRGYEGLLFVPENRRNADSRVIAIHYLRFPKREPSALPPVFVLPGGPGDFIGADELREGLRNPDRYSLARELAAYNRRRDIVVINQRGHHQSPGLNKLPAAWIANPPSDARKPFSIAESSTRLAAGLKTELDRCRARGIDLAGYDLLDLADDVDDLREALGYDTMALRGNSFGSQWALACIKLRPEHVDRAILGGVEPLDHAYDSPQGLWNVLARVEQQALHAENLELPEVGLLGAVQTIIQRLEQAPVTIRGRHPRRELFVDVTIGPDDFRRYLTHPILDSQPHSRRSLELWPKFVIEIYKRDYQYLAARIIDDRPEPVRVGVLYTLIDNSVGISPERERSLTLEPAFRWLGDVNWQYKAVRPVLPAPVVDEALRKFDRCPVPVLLIQGDLDLATPLENAEALLASFPNGHLLRVGGGTHAAMHHAASVTPEFVQMLAGFMNSDDPVGRFAELPKVIDLPPLRFEALGSASLFQQLVRGE